MDCPLVYLACPYTHEHPYVVELRVDFASKVAAKLFRDGLIVFSPISYLHEVARKNQLPATWEFWESVLTAYLSCSRKLYVITLDGWDESIGVQAEISISRQFKIPIEYLNPAHF